MICCHRKSIRNQASVSIQHRERRGSRDAIMRQATITPMNPPAISGVCRDAEHPAQSEAAIIDTQPLVWNQESESRSLATDQVGVKIAEAPPPWVQEIRAPDRDERWVTDVPRNDWGLRPL